MERKSTLVTLGILGAVAALGASCCCCINWVDDWQREDGLAADDKAGDDKGAGHVAHTRYRPHVFVPIFWGGGGRYGPGPGPGHTTTAPGSPRGGFGATASSHGGGPGT